METAARAVIIAVVAFTVVFGVGFVTRELPDWGDPSGRPLSPLPGFGGDLARADGVVQRSAGGGWEDIATGTPIFERDVLRVGNASFAWVTLAGGRPLQLGAESVTSIEPAGSVLLKAGALRIEAGEQPVAIAVDHGGVVKVGNGPVSVRVLEDDTIEVHNEGDAVVEVSFGEQRSLVPPGRLLIGGANGIDAPRAPPEVAEAVRFKRVPKLARGDKLVVEGRLDPALRVASASVSGVDVEIAPDGSFRVAVPLTVGVNRISLVTRDVFGNEQVYDIDPVRRLSDAEVNALRFEWSRSEQAKATWGE